MNNFALEPNSKLCSFHSLFVNPNICQIFMRFEETNCAWNNWFTEVQLWRFGRNCCRWTGFIWSLLVTQVVTYIRTTPTPSLLLFIPYKSLVCMMKTFGITKEEDTICEKIWCCIFLSFVSGFSVSAWLAEVSWKQLFSNSLKAWFLYNRPDRPTCPDRSK